MGDLYSRLKAQRERQKSMPVGAQGEDLAKDGRKPVSQWPAEVGDGWNQVAELVWERRRVVTIDPDWWDFVSADLDTVGKAELQQRLSGLLSIDTETTGLSGGTGTFAFLIGWCRLMPPQAEIRQVFMQDFGGEPAMIDHIDRLLQEAQAYASYNGASFDLPLLRMRWALSGREFPERPHEDCLHPARRIWKSLLGNCSLGSVEAGVLGFQRPDDVPGALVPQMYFDYLKSGAGPDFATQLGGVFRHHACDVYSVSMLQLLLAALRRDIFSARWLNDSNPRLPCIGHYDGGIVQPLSCPVLPIDPKGLLRFCSPAQARELEEKMWQTTRQTIWGMLLAHRYRRGRQPQEIRQAAAIWWDLWQNQGHFAALLAWLKYAEHLSADTAIWRQALALVEHLLAENSLNEIQQNDLQRRKLRLGKRLNRINALTDA